ncbi:arrestin domain-containing protein 3-like isoform X2 [Mytilus edulis]|uniref:arrestin domain-containing protein 3-like isoform X2 n=1 Tax=Mytilus edulis TaxID=6550 RepID=UPI0039EF2695
MGKLNKLEIQFDRSKMVCYSGETLKGTVVIDLNGNLKIKGIRLRFHGYASVHWVERYSSGTGKNKRTVAKHFDAVEQYFDHSAYVFGANKAETHYLPQGVHKFPFEFFVPTGCPTTYEGSIGRVRTYVSATLEKLWVADISTLKPFTVINPLDLNKDPRAKNVRYHSQKKSKTHQNVIAHMKRNVSKSIDTDVLEDKILIPSIPPSFLNGCNIIDISYILEVIIQPSGLSFDIPVRMELIVGTYPMESTIRSLTQSTIILSSPNSTNGEKHTKKKEIQNGLVVSGNPKSCMSFMESVIGKVTIEDEEESDNIEDKIVYTPVYPYLSVQQNTDLFCVDLTSR